MTDNKCVVYVEPGKVSVEKIDYPKLELPPGVPGRNRLCEHGVILRTVATNICGSDLHMVRGRRLLRRPVPCKPGPGSVVAWLSSPGPRDVREP
jgi:threonine dehydrogenase-like Zn-dependent dehydrogenase